MTAKTKSAHRPTARERVGLLAHKARTQIGRVDNPEVRKARTMARLTRRGALDIAYLGDSTVTWVAPYDEDRRPLHQLIRDDLGLGRRMHAIYGGSYNPPLFSGILRQMERHGSKPVVIVPLCVRMSTQPWVEHPVHGHKVAASFLASLEQGAPLRAIRMGLPPASPEEWQRFHEIPHPTWAGDLKVGDYVRLLKNASARDEDWVRLLYAYHHGGAIHDGPLEVVTRMGQQLRELGVPTVAYQTPVPVEKGVDFYGPSFRTLAEENLAKLEKAFRAGYGPIEVLQTALIHPTSSYLDPNDGSEHLNLQGRRVLADAISAAVREHL